jgi:hypothetical protein
VSIDDYYPPKKTGVNTPSPITPVAFVAPAPERPTLRDQFAIAALPDLVALNLAASEQEIAAMAYRQADAMMKERSLHAPPVEVKG